MTTRTAREWWTDLSAGIPTELHGLWFGLVELSPGGWHIYVAGTASFDADDETAEWATGPYVWLPEDRYFPFPQAATSDVAAAVEAAAAFVRSLEPWSVVSVDGVAAGFDDGDFVLVNAG